MSSLFIFKVQSSIYCPDCEHEEDDIWINITSNGKYERYTCPKCGLIQTGENDEEIANELIKTAQIFN